jgi:beta-glucosidase
MNDRAAARKFATLTDPPALDIEAIVASATVAEKVAFLCGKGLWRTAPIDRLRVPAIVMTDGTHGVRYSESQIDLGQSWGRREASASSLPPEAGSAPSRFADVDTIPATVAFGKSRPATCFPTGSSLACSWDPDLARLMGNALAEECLQMGVGVLLGPGINIRRTPLAGRSYEYYSEDPYLTGELAAAIIIGIQEKGVGACLKHFACNNSEFQRTQMDSVVDERALREIYLAAFEHAIRKADPWLVMSSYNRLNGQQASENRWLLERVLREEWSYTGVVVSDWYGTKDRPKSLLAGNDISMPEYAVDQKELLLAAESGLVPLEVLDRSVIRLLRLVGKATAHRKSGHQADLLAHHKLAQRIARESIVLLKNEDGLLPIDLNRSCKVLVAGPCAVTPVIQGAGCATTTPWMLDKPLDEIVEIAGNAMSIAYAAGTATDGTRDPQALEHVSALAAESDLVLLFVSSPIGEDGENGDRSDLRILAAHEELIERIAAVQGNLVVLVASSDSVEMPWLPKVKALMHLFYAGQGMGRAVAEILFGLANPCGRLTTTAPNTLEETPAFLHYPGENLRNLYAEGIYVGYRYYDRRKMQPLFPFGFGLSYTSFEYEKIVLSDRLFGEEDTMTIEVTIRNVGTRAGKEVVQIYIEGPPGRLARPPLELKAFAKVELQPGDRQVAQLQIAVARLACYDTALAAWIVEAGRYRILAGSSSRDIRLSAEALVGAPERLPPLPEDCSLQDLIRHVTAFTRVCELFARKSGKSLEEARATLRINAPDIFTSVYIALTSTFELDIDREEFRQALHGD